MFGLLVEGEKGGKIIDIPIAPPLLQYNLFTVGLPYKLDEITLGPKDGFDPVKNLIPYDPVSNRLGLVFNGKTTLEELNRVSYLVDNAPKDFKNELDNLIIEDKFKTSAELLETIHQMKMALVNSTINYYCPLKVIVSNDEEDDDYQVSSEYASHYIDEIKRQLCEEQRWDLNDMAVYFNRSDSAKAKLVSAIWDVESVNGKLYGVIHTMLKEPFTEDEEKAWISELVGQAADGFGESFEQRGIETEDGQMFVSFWDFEDDYFMENQHDFDLRMQNESSMSINFT